MREGSLTPQDPISDLRPRRNSAENGEAVSSSSLLGKHKKRDGDNQNRQIPDRAGNVFAVTKQKPKQEISTHDVIGVTQTIDQRLGSAPDKGIVYGSDDGPADNEYVNDAPPESTQLTLNK